ncbi:MAG TPA: polyprenol phosphomannose-dependent alpha 1,6 mannosyltransferase MptB [Solirubrobacteraceae bacterium]|nr:polyprenol phosphomannose-dependent alpha 1,6 mannosyltransferase MptB [Solirubrobacteraceae bacterium]
MSVRGPLGATAQSASVELTRGPSLDARAAPAASSRRALLAVAGLVTSGFVIAISAANTETLLPLSIRPVPSSLAGAFGSANLNLRSGGAIAVLILMTACYAIVAVLANELSTRTVLMAIAALNAIVLLAPPLVSTDVFSYQAYARMGSLFGTNPYLSGPHALGIGDPVFPYIGAKWSYIPSVYGPAFTMFSYLLAPLAVGASVLVYKSIATASSLGIVALTYNAARLRGVNPVRAAALVGLNPLLILYGVGGGHNDLVMLLAMVAAVYAILRSRERLGGALTVLAIGVKLTAGILLPFVIAAGGPLRGRGRRRDLLIGAGATFAALGSLTLAFFGPGVINVLPTIQRSQSEGDWHSLAGALVTRLGMVTIGHVVGYLLAAAFVVVFAWLVRRVWRGELDWIDGVGWATAAMLIAASSLLPWYVAWLLPFAALSSDRRLFRTALVITCVVQGVELLGYIPHGVSLPGL